MSEGSAAQGRIARRASLVALGTLGSRILGAARDAVIAASFATAVTDLFWLAFTIPNAFRVLLGEGAVSGAFVPVYVEAREKEGVERARRVLGQIAGGLLFLLTILVVLGIAFAEELVTVYGSGLRERPEDFAVAVELTRAVFPYVLLAGLAALATGALNASGRFGWPAFAPAFLNIALIAAPFVFVDFVEGLGYPAIFALVVGTLLGGVLQLGVQLPPAKKLGLPIAPRFERPDPYTRKAFKLLLPLLAALGVYQLNVALSRTIASHQASAISYLYYGQRLVEIPQGMFAMAIATAALPSISEAVARGDRDAAKTLFRSGLRMALFVSLPSSALLIALGTPSVAVLFGRGAFGETAIVETGRSLVAQAAGIWAVASIRTVVPLFHALNDTRTPVVASGLNLVVFGATAFLLFPLYGHVGLACAITAAAAVQLAGLLLLLRHRVGPLGFRSLVRPVGSMLVAAVGAGAAMAFVASFGDWRAGGNVPTNLGLFVLAALVGGGVYVGLAYALGVDELRALLAAVKRKLGRR
ncbi:MAG: murein biosynthesis integral membrane protein MurJ [Myxococcales bacterium]|nr:murein biosynthesis integral membrane protein MurJ [Myxococcales bacterium]